MPAYATAARFDVEADAVTVRSEAVRAIRGVVKCPAPAIDRPSDPSPRVVIRGVVGILRDLEQSLRAISQSLAESVESTMARD